MCVPVSITGRGSGVLHVVGPSHEVAPEHVVDRLELVARKLGDHIGMLRAFSRSAAQARTDPLTGLLNRRSLEEEVRDLDETSSYVVAYGDLDHFKQLNDVHDAGDRALRLFARVLRDGVRPGDLPARYGGEECVVVLPDCSVDDAQMVVERLRVRLEESLHRGSVSPFTVSFGIAPARARRPFPRRRRAGRSRPPRSQGDGARPHRRARRSRRTFPSGLTGSSGFSVRRVG